MLWMGIEFPINALIETAVIVSVAKAQPTHNFPLIEDLKTLLPGIGVAYEFRQERDGFRVGQRQRIRNIFFILPYINVTPILGAL